MKKLLTGNEAIAQGAFENGVRFASAYPGTPSTEILENLSTFKEIDAEWAPNEKTALEAAIGASLAGARSMASMKHVGVNVAADPLFAVSYTGINSALVLISADEPGQHSSQNEQDNRHYARAAKIPMLEPSDSQECKDMMGTALELSEKFDTPFLIRMTTRVCHSKGIVECGERKEVPLVPYVRNPDKYITVPAFSRKRRVIVEKRSEELLAYSEQTPLNRIEWQRDKKIGVVTSGVCYHYAREVFGDTVSYLKLGFTWPLPINKIREFCSQLQEIYVIEENDSYLEEMVLMYGYYPNPKGKNVLPHYGEMLPEVIRKSFLGESKPLIPYDETRLVPRPPSFCAGCPHRGFFYELGRRKDVIITNDIGCYGLGYAEPFNAQDFNMCMGSAFSVGHGAQKIFKTIPGFGKKTVALLGDSTFFHTGMNSLLEAVYNNSDLVCVILDNAITGMTGHQNNPGNGLNAKGEIATRTSIEAVVKALGVKHIRTVNPNNLKEMKAAFDWAIGLDELAVIITRWPCVLKRITAEEKETFDNPFSTKCVVDETKCIGCKLCIKSGCPALSFETAVKKAKIDPVQCVGCEVCNQLCPKNAIVKEEK
jgi:indolepyruvate ferredoxin oxidoreductase alpha subunit